MAKPAGNDGEALAFVGDEGSGVMSSFWQIGTGAADEAGPFVTEEKPLSQEDAEAILNGLAGTYSKQNDIVASLGAVRHFFERLDTAPVSEE